MGDRAPFLRSSDIHDFGDGAKISAVPDLEAPSISQQKKAPHDET